MKIKYFALVAMVAVAFTACDNKKPEPVQEPVQEQTTHLSDKYAEYTLTTNIDHLSDNEREMLRLLFEAADIMDGLFWNENYGDKDELMAKIGDNADIKKLATIAYGPWDGLDGNKPFVEGIGAKPAGAQFYPADMTEEEWNTFDDPNKTSQYTMIVRDENGALKCVWYHDYFAEQIEKAASLLDKASELAGDKEFATYLKLRAQALRTDDYLESDMQWMDVRNNNIDMVIGPIENYTDARYGIKASHEAFILIKDQEWTKQLARYASFVPALQKQLPVPAQYKKEVPGSDVDLAAYDVVYYAGDCNANSKTIAINLPNDERVQLQRGTRKLQLKNAMQAKFDKILDPISKELMTSESLEHIKFDAFFANVMFHETAHGMGIKNTITGKGTVREALGNQYNALEEAKADVLGLYLVTKLAEMGEYTNTTMEDNYTTFMAGIFRSVRFGAASAHGKANMLTFNYFQNEGAFVRNEQGKYAIDFEKMKVAVEKLAGDILQHQGNGDYEATKAWMGEMTVIKPELQADLDRVNEAGIPTDIYFNMGPQVLLK
ncbi:MAG: Zn-dependent hydrolase [Bacteroidales bacterium]|nr:Zn-dependent hydrolase [Bacteroidales bacterium]